VSDLGKLLNAAWEHTKSHSQEWLCDKNELQDFCSGAGGGGAFVAVVVVFEGGVFVGG